MTGEAAPFLLPVTYWPARTGPFLWNDFRPDEVRRDLEAASTAGLAQLLLTLPWDVLQPDPLRTAVEPMRHLEWMLERCSDTGVALLVSVLAASVFDRDALPGWTYEIDTAFAGAEARTPRNLYVDTRVTAGERLALREVIGEFDSHPGVAGWIVGSGYSTLSPPPSIGAFEGWLGEVVGAAGSYRKPLWLAISARDLLSARIDPGQVHAARIGTLIDLDARPGWARDAVLWPPFLASFAAALDAGPSVIRPSLRTWPEVAGASPEDLQAAIDRIAGAGAAGFVAAALFDYGPDLERRLGEAALRRGLMSSDRSPRPAGVAWAEAAAQKRAIVAPPPLDVDRDAWLRDPKGTVRQLFGAFTR